MNGDNSSPRSPRWWWYEVRGGDEMMSRWMEFCDLGWWDVEGMIFFCLCMMLHNRVADRQHWVWIFSKNYEKHSPSAHGLRMAAKKLLMMPKLTTHIMHMVERGYHGGYPKVKKAPIKFNTIQNRSPALDKLQRLESGSGLVIKIFKILVVLETGLFFSFSCFSSYSVRYLFHLWKK
jgi:hypothetical protein